MNGQISVALALSGTTLAGRPQVRANGVPVEDEREDFLAEAEDAVADAVSSGARDIDKLREDVRLAVRRVATRWTGKKPVVDVLIVEV